MLTKLEPFKEFQPTKLMSYNIEKFLRQYEITDFVVNSFQDTLLLTAGIQEGIEPLGVEFGKTESIRVSMLLKSSNLAKVEEFFDFLLKFDPTTTWEHKDKTHFIQMNCITYKEKIVPLFEKAFLERIKANPECLKKYQKESKIGYEKFLSRKIQEDTTGSSAPAPMRHKDRFFLNTGIQAVTPVAICNKDVTANTTTQPGQ